MLEPVQRGHVVQEFMLGKTKVRICDDYCRDKTPEDVKAILDRISRRVVDHLLSDQATPQEKSLLEFASSAGQAG